MTKPNRHSTHEKMPGLYALGEKYIALGEAFQDDRTTLDELVRLSLECGLMPKLTLAAHGDGLPVPTLESPKDE